MKDWTSAPCETSSSPRATLSAFGPTIPVQPTGLTGTTTTRSTGSYAVPLPQKSAVMSTICEPATRDWLPAGTVHSARVVSGVAVTYLVGSKRPA
jgi:hypothetical protein